MNVGSFSVALATHNGEQFLPAQLASLAAQTTLPREVVVCDDASSDGTLAVLERFREDAPFPVRVHPNEERRGFSDTFLRAASECRGNRIAFCDQDDVWLESKLERCASELAREDVILVMHSSRVADAQLRPTRRMYPHFRGDRVEPPLAGDPWRAVRGMSMAFGAELLRVADAARRPASHYAPGQMHHDEWIYVLARALGAISYVSEPLALYRQHGANVTGAARGSASLPELVGATYYARRRDQALALAALLDEIGSERATAAAAWYRRQAAALESRLSVYDLEAPTTRRLGRLVRLARSGTYRSRERGGFGARGLVRDALMIALRRTG